ncbi:P-loop containing nucleoside triphosphate hydrolase protein [Apiospora aurea]|uniref:P-loop containing nucleoside triphosphate hydrolase protein n=1 Tax=Apiospora aurea TaxID=335848 RepID=A0ABR1QIE3_9PEZI
MENITSSLPPLEEVTPMGIFQALLGQWAGKMDVTQFSSILTLTAFAFGTLRWLRGSTSSVVDSLRDYATIRVVIPSSNEMSTFVTEWVNGTILPRRYNQSYIFRETVNDEEGESGGGTGAVVPIVAEEDEDDEEEDADSGSAAAGGDLVLKKDRQQADRPIECVPQFNRTWFFYRGRFFTIRRGKKGSSADDSDDDDDVEGTDVFGKPHMYSLKITCVSHSSQPVVEFLEMCRTQAKAGIKKKPQIRIHGHDGYRYWGFKGKSPVRPLSSIHLDNALKKDLLADIEKYLSPATRRRYHQRNIPYQRGYLLHGPPGTGKSTLASVLAGRYGLSLYVLQLAHIDDNDLERLFQDLPSRCIVLMEDIDAAGIDREETDSEDSENESDKESSSKKKSDGKKDPKVKRKESECTLSGILNVLDGVGSQEGRIVIMTTNFPDELDEALVRPGRIDKKIYIGYISRKSCEEMFVRMFRPIKNDKKSKSKSAIYTSNKAVKDGYVKISEKKSGMNSSDESDAEDDEVCRCEKCKATTIAQLASEFAQLVPENSITPSELQGFFQVHLDCPVEAVERFGDWMWQMREEKAPRRRKQQQREQGVISLPDSPRSEKTDEGEQQPVSPS